MIARLLGLILVALAGALLGRSLKLRPELGKELRRRFNLAFSVAVGGYVLLAVVRLALEPPRPDQLVTLGGVVAALGLIWLALRLALALGTSR